MSIQSDSTFAGGSSVSREIVERQQHLAIFSEARCRRRVLSAERLKEKIERLAGVLPRRGHPDVVQHRLRPGLDTLRHLVQHVGRLVDPTALGFWKALRQVYSKTRVPRCWVHKTANLLNKMPKSIQAKAKSMLHDIWMASTRKDASEAFVLFLETFSGKYPAATRCLEKDCDVLLAFYDFPAEHWIHLRTSNPIESTFATVRLRTAKTKGCGSRTACLSMVFKLALSAQKRWRALNGAKLLADVITGVVFEDGVKKLAA